MQSVLETHLRVQITDEHRIWFSLDAIFQGTETEGLLLECINLSVLVDGSRNKGGAVVEEGKGVSGRRYRDHTRLTRQGGDAEIDKVAHRNGYFEGIFDLGDLGLGREIVVKYRERLADLREELVMIQKVDDLCIEKLSEHHLGF